MNATPRAPAPTARGIHELAEPSVLSSAGPGTASAMVVAGESSAAAAVVGGGVVEAALVVVVRASGRATDLPALTGPNTVFTVSV